MRQQRVFLRAWLATAALLVCGACVQRQYHAKSAATPSPQAAGRVSVEITYAYWALNRREVALVRDLKAEFQRRRPGVTVRLVEIPQRYYEKLQILMASGEAPDVFTANYGRLADYAKAGVLRDLRPWVKAQAGLAGEYPAAIWAATVRLGGAIGHPGVWGLPRDWPPAGMLLYNHDLLAAAGVQEPRGAWTWEQFREACRKVKAARLAGVTPTAINLYPYSVLTWFAQAGAEAPWLPGAPPAHAHRAAEAVDFVLGLWREGLATRPNPADDDSLQQFSAGRVAFCFGTFYSLQEFAHACGFEWGVAAPLRYRRQACSCLPTFLAISERCRAPEAAFEWARFLSIEGAAEYARRYLTAPAARRGLDAGVFLTSPPLDRARNAVMTALAVADPPPISKVVSYEKTIEELRRALESVISGRASSYEALEAMRRRLTKGQQE